MIFESPVFQIANAQYQRACEWLDVPQDAMERTRLPKRALVVQVPVRMDDGCFCNPQQCDDLVKST